MTQLKRFVAISAAVALAAAWNNVMAQDDLDDLLRDLEADVAPAKPAAQKPADAKPADGKATAPAQEPAKKAGRSRNPRPLPSRRQSLSLRLLLLRPWPSLHLR